MKMRPTSLAVLLATLSMAAHAEFKAPTVYGQLSAEAVHFNDTNFLGNKADTTPYLSHAIVGFKGLNTLSDGLKLSYVVEADFAPLVDSDGTKSRYYSALDQAQGKDDEIKMRYAAFALITDYGLFAVGNYKSGIYDEFFSQVDIFELNTQESTPSALPNGMRMWSQTKWTTDGLIYKSPLWHNLYTRLVFASVDNDNGTNDDLKIAQVAYKTDRFMLGSSLSLYDKKLTGVSDGSKDRKRIVIGSHYNWDNFHLAGVYEINRGVGSASADFEVGAVTGTYLYKQFDFSLGYQHRSAPDQTARPIKEEKAVIGQVKYHQSKHLDFWLEAGSYHSADNDNIGAGINVYF